MKVIFWIVKLLTIQFVFFEKKDYHMIIELIPVIGAYNTFIVSGVNPQNIQSLIDNLTIKL